MSATPTQKLRETSVWLGDILRGRSHVKVDGKRGSGAPLPPDTLSADSVLLQSFGHLGVPANTDAVAIDPSQGLLAAGTSDGRVKVFGRPGVELLFCSASRSPTCQLLFLPSRPGVLRIAKDGLVEVFGLLPPYTLCGSIPDLGFDPPRCVSVWPMEDGQDFLLFGCASGSLRVARVMPGSSSNSGVAGNPDMQIRGLTLLPYGVAPEHWGGGGAVAGPLLRLETQPGGDGDCLLVIHRDGLIVWSLRYAGPSVALHRLNGPNRNDIFREIGNIQAGCWAHSNGGKIATAHSNGDIVLWQLPESALPGASPPPGSLVRSDKLEPITALRVCSDNFTSAMETVRLLGDNMLLVQGGQSVVEPEGLAVLYLKDDTDEEDVEWCPLDGPLPKGEICAEMTFLPWFGSICALELVARLGHKDKNGGGGGTPLVLVLNEGGQLIVHDIGGHEASQYSLSSQALGTVTRLAWLQRGIRRPQQDPYHPQPLALCADDLAILKNPSQAPIQHQGKQPALANGGRPAPSISGGRGTDDFLATGHSDGSVVLWDGRTRVPAQAAVVIPLNNSEGVAAVTAMAMCWAAGILAVGHKDGYLRLYQWSSTSREAVAVTADLHGTRPAPGQQPVQHPTPGFHQLLTSDVHKGSPITEIALGTAHNLIAFGDGAGNVSLFDLGGGSFYFVLAVSPTAPQGVVSLRFGTDSDPQPVNASLGASSSAYFPAKGAVCMDLLLYCLLEDFTLAVVDCHAEGRVVATSHCDASEPRKHGFAAVGMELLNDSGFPQPPPTGPANLVWADAIDSAAEALTQAGDIEGDARSKSSKHETSGKSLSSSTSDMKEEEEEPSADAEAAEEEEAESAASSDSDDILAEAAAAVEKHEESPTTKKWNINKNIIPGAKVIKALKIAPPKLDQVVSGLPSAFSHKKKPPGDLKERTEPNLKSPKTPKDEGLRSQDRAASKSPEHMLPVKEDDVAASSQPSASALEQEEAGGSFKTSKQIFKSSSSLHQADSIASFEVVDKSMWTPLVLLVSEQCMEVCWSSRVGGARQAAASVYFSKELRCQSAAPVVTAQGAAVAVLSANNQLVVYSLPNLSSLLKVHLEYCLGWPFSGQISRALTASGPDGQMALISANGELVRLGLGGPMSLPLPQSVFDMPVARQTRSRDLTRTRVWEANYKEEVGKRAGGSPSVEEKRPAFLANLEKIGGDLMKNMGIAPKTRQPMRLQRRFIELSVSSPVITPMVSVNAPDVSRLRSNVPVEEDSLEIDEIEDMPDINMSRGETHKQGTWETRLAQRGKPSQDSSFIPKTRTAEEIKQKYGKSSSAQRSAEQATDVMSNNVRRLEERQERLGRLQDKTANMENNARGFAEAAEELLRKQQNKKWWQL